MAVCVQVPGTSSNFTQSSAMRKRRRHDQSCRCPLMGGCSQDERAISPCIRRSVNPGKGATPCITSHQRPGVQRVRILAALSKLPIRNGELIVSSNRSYGHVGICYFARCVVARYSNLAKTHTEQSFLCSLNLAFSPVPYSIESWHHSTTPMQQGISFGVVVAKSHNSSLLAVSSSTWPRGRQRARNDSSRMRSGKREGLFGRNERFEKKMQESSNGEPPIRHATKRDPGSTSPANQSAPLGPERSTSRRRRPSVVLSNPSSFGTAETPFLILHGNDLPPSRLVLFTAAIILHGWHK